MNRLPKSGSFWFAFSAALLLLAGILLSVGFWGWLHPTAPTTVSNSETLRNVGLLIGGVLAFVFAVWRGWVAERQASAAQRQADIAQQSLLNERYERGAEMLGSVVLSVRLAGIYALRRLAEEHPEQYHIQIMELLCAFARNPAGSQEGQNVKDVSPNQSSLREDVQAVMTAIGGRGEVGRALEKRAKFTLDLHGADLRDQNLHNLNLSESQLSYAKLSDAYMFRTNLSDAQLFKADLSGAKLASVNLTGASLSGANLSCIKECYGTNFSNAVFDGTNLTDADLSGTIVSGARLLGANLAGAKFYNDSGMMVEGLTQKQIAFAKAIPENKPPSIYPIKDAETGEPISWDKRPTIV